MDKTIVLLKPDAVALGIQPELEEALTSLGLHCMLKGVLLQLTKDLILTWRDWDHYDDWFWEHVDFMTSSPVEIWLVCGENAIDKVISVKLALRQKYAKSKVMNVLHCPDNKDEANREINIFLNRGS
ncbi:MAG: nucleoside-diphosphate kinase [Candidatus Omnitrophica bacterium]|nr:nucleoside-diphosphate kinase [Candidatus Omnitrophota bacterium]